MNKPWWDLADKEEIHEEVFKAVNNIRNNQQRYDDLDQRHFRLYSGLPLFSAFTNDIIDDGEIRFTMNVVQSGVNTMVSKITKNKVRPTYLTDDGDWGMQEEAKKLDRYIFGQFYKSKVYEESKKAFRDACVFGDGFVKHWHDSDGNIHIKRVFKPSLLFDLAECMFSDEPKTVFEVRIVNKEALKKKYPDFAVEIEASKISDLPFFVDSTEANTQLCAVVEGYRAGYKKTRNKDAKVKETDKELMVPGRHFIGISTCTFLNEEFKMDKIPYVRMAFVPNALGYMSKGIAELITGHQVEINRTLKRISRAMNLMTSPSIFIDYMSEIVETHFNNDVGNIIKFKDQPPIYNFPAGISPTVIEWFVMVYQKAFEEIGLSQLTAQAKLPGGLSGSGSSLREYNDIETERFAEVAQNWEQFHLDIAEAIEDHSHIIAEEGGAPVVLSPNKMGAQKIDFKKIKIKGSEYIRQCYPTSMLPKTPAGRLAFIGEMSDRQWIDAAESMSLLEFPDTESIIGNKTAHIDFIKYVADAIIQDLNYIPPEPYQNLDYGIQYMDALYLKMSTRKLPTERLDLLQRWINDALALQQEMTTPSADTPEAPTPDLLTEQAPGAEMAPVAPEMGVM